jgi:hypothetical protein
MSSIVVDLTGRGSRAGGPTRTERVRLAVVELLRAGQWPHLAVLRERFPEESTAFLNGVRSDVSARLGLTRQNGQVSVDLDRLHSL